VKRAVQCCVHFARLSLLRECIGFITVPISRRLHCEMIVGEGLGY
jgi:hypothetical protein